MEITESLAQEYIGRGGLKKKSTVDALHIAPATLEDYARFVEHSRPKRKGDKITESEMRSAIDYCVAHDILKPILSKLSQEGVKMLTTMFNLEAAKRVWREDWLEEGIERGIERGHWEVAQNLKRLGIPDDSIIKAAGITPADLKRLNGFQGAL